MLKRFKLSYKRRIVELSVAVVFVVALFAILGMHIYQNDVKQEASALQAGDVVRLIKGDRIDYGSWNTYHYTLVTETEAFVSYCAEPSLSPVEGFFTAINVENSAPNANYIKLLIYIMTVDTELHRQMANYLFGSVGISLLYAYTHAAIGYMYAGDTVGLDGDLYSLITSVPEKLGAIISNSPETWNEAMAYTLYGLDLNDYGSDTQDMVWIATNPEPEIYGNLRIEKHDIETNSSFPLGDAFLSLIWFDVYNASGASIVYDGVTYADGEKITSISTDESGVAYLSNLPQGTYLIMESATNSSYLVSTASEYATISYDGETAVVTMNNQVVRGDVKFTKTDKNSGSKMANIPFRITSKTTNESHIVVSNSDGVVDTSLATHSNNTNGYDSLTNFDNITNQGYGTWFGLNASGAQVSVNNALGALPYDTYEITEILCEQNSNCKDVTTSKKTVTIDTNLVTVDLGTWENDCEEEIEYSVGTTATDGDGNKELAPGQNATIKDVISYCLKAGESYTIRGELRDKNTGNKLLVNGSAIEQTIQLTPSANCGQTEMTFTFDATELGGAQIVVFEYVYQGENLIVSHATTKSPEQTVRVSEPESDGEIIIIKHDYDTRSCEAQGSASLGGAKFEIRNALSRSIIYNGQTISAGGLVATIEIDASTCRASIQNLPYGTYEIVEIAAGTGYVLDQDTTVTVEVNSTAKVIERTFYNQIIRGDVRLVKTNERTGKKMANIPFRITSKSTGENHIVVTNADGVMSTASAFAKHDNHTNGYDTLDIYGISFLSYGTWFGKLSNGGQISVNNNLGALPYGTYEIAELACLGNRFCADIASEKRTFTIDTNGSVVMIGEWENDCVTFSAKTTAVDQSDGDKTVIASGKVAIKDTIEYCLMAGKKFTFKGVLVDRATGAELLIGGRSIEQTITITPTTDCGQAEMVFEFDATGLNDMDLVVFEYIYYEDELILEHADTEDKGQTVSLVTPTKPIIPNTGLNTGEANDGKEDCNYTLIVVGVGLIVVVVHLGLKVIPRKRRINFGK